MLDVSGPIFPAPICTVLEVGDEILEGGDELAKFCRAHAAGAGLVSPA
jgi:hypothetical protein